MSGDTLSYRQIAKMIDISAVHTQDGELEIRKLIKHAKTYAFGAVHVLPAWVTVARSLLDDAQDIALGSPVGFPSGGNHLAIKRAEAIQIVADGADELDMMLNVGKLRSGEDRYIYDELCSVIGAVQAPVKVILETHYLTNDEIKRACELSIEAGAKYVKTATGWAPSGATLENIALITACVGNRIGVKAAGGVRDLDSLIKMYKLGARRFGINVNAAVAIVNACKALPGGTVDMTL